jgi:hypothetical protein
VTGGSEGIDAALAAGTAALGSALTGAEALAGGSDRSALIRARAGDGTAVVVKTYPADGLGPASFAAEAAGLAVAGGSGRCPRLLGADAASRTVVMTDLGRGPSLADLLLDGSADAAGTALLAWAQGLGEVAVAAAGREDEHAAALDGYLGGRPDETSARRLGERVSGAAGRAALLGVGTPNGLGADLAAVSAMLESPRWRVFSPGDECPDNNIITPAGMRFLDLEDAGFYPAFVAGGFVRAPFATCWCVFRLPSALAAEARERHRAGLTKVHPGLADDRVWGPGVRLAGAAWVLNSMYWPLNRALKGDAPLEPGRPSPGARQVMRYRWARLRDELTQAGELPALTELLDGLLAATRGWAAPELPLYPAFRA